MLLFVDNLTNVDFSYLHPERGLLGETWLADLEVQGALDDQGMICDFGILKSTLRQWLDEHLDHKLLVPELADCLNLQQSPGRTSLTWHYGDVSLQTSAPHQAFTLVQKSTITPESISAWVQDKIASLLPAGVTDVRLSFRQETIDGACYHYSHGLKKHQGNCQRIAHGHRSRIQLWRNGQRDSQLEMQWAERFRDIYLGSREDIVQDDGQQFRFAYESSQGSFELCLPQQSCYLIDSETTVEEIARHLSQEITAAHPNDQFRVKAFEGALKGAIVDSSI